jgi:hypothetical protein
MQERITAGGFIGVVKQSPAFHCFCADAHFAIVEVAHPGMTKIHEVISSARTGAQFGQCDGDVDHSRCEGSPQEGVNLTPANTIATNPFPVCYAEEKKSNSDGGSSLHVLALRRVKRQ